MSLNKNNDILLSLFGRQTPSMSYSPNQLNVQNGRSHPTKLIHSKSVGCENPTTSVPVTPKSRPGHAKRTPRRTLSSFSMSSSPVIIYNSNYNNGHQMTTPRKVSSSPFAGSKFSDSPSARAIPLPPMNWFEDEEDEDEDTRELGNSCISATSDTESSDSLSSSGTSTSSVSLSTGPSGLRINPLQLIAAVSAS